jgi:plasmid replication initiation protein
LKLKERLKIIDPTKKVEKHKVWSSFSRDALEVPKKEINKKSELYFIYILQKTGRKYTDIEFAITPNSRKEATYEGGLFKKTE